MTKRQLEEGASQQGVSPFSPSPPRLSDEALGKKKLRGCFFDQCYVLVDAAEILLPRMNDSLAKEASSYFNDGDSSLSERSTNSLNLNEESLEEPSPSDVINASDDNSMPDLPFPLPLARDLLCSSFKDLLFGSTDDVASASLDREPSSEPEPGLSEAALILSCRSRTPVVCLSDAALLASICRDVTVVLERLPPAPLCCHRRRRRRRRRRPKSAHPWLCFDPDRIYTAAAADSDPEPPSPPPPPYAPPSPLQEVALPDEAGQARHADRLFDSIDLNAQETVTDAFMVFDFDARWKRVETTRVEVSVVTC